ncbi:MAG: LacI family DNA-binding transcriptional regulator, partial [Pseudomonadota bacterium]
MSVGVTMRDVADAVGMSPMTVSRALRDDPRVNART